MLTWQYWEHGWFDKEVEGIAVDYWAVVPGVDGQAPGPEGDVDAVGAHLVPAPVPDDLYRGRGGPQDRVFVLEGAEPFQSMEMI